MVTNATTTATNAIATSTTTTGCWKVVLLWSVFARPFSICNVYLFKDIRSFGKRLNIWQISLKTDLSSCNFISKTVT